MSCTLAVVLPFSSHACGSVPFWCSLHLWRNWAQLQSKFCLYIRIKGDKLSFLLHTYPVENPNSGTPETGLALMSMQKFCWGVAANAPRHPSFLFHLDSFLELNAMSWTQAAVAVWRISNLKSSPDSKVKLSGWQGVSGGDKDCTTECAVYIWTCLLVLFPSRASADTPEKDRNTWSSRCFGCSWPLCIS